MANSMRLRCRTKYDTETCRRRRPLFVRELSSDHQATFGLRCLTTPCLLISAPCFLNRIPWFLNLIRLSTSCGTLPQPHYQLAFRCIDLQQFPISPNTEYTVREIQNQTTITTNILYQYNAHNYPCTTHARSAFPCSFELSSSDNADASHGRCWPEISISAKTAIDIHCTSIALPDWLRLKATGISHWLTCASSQQLSGTLPNTSCPH
jgi:hypothetical protein